MTNKLFTFSDLKTVFVDMGIDGAGFSNPMLKKDLGLDSQEFIEFVIELETALGLEIPDGLLKNDDTITGVLVKLNNLQFGFSDHRVDTIKINSDLHTVKQAIWDLHSWESKLTHINSLNIIEQSDSYQEFWMEVVSENSIVKAESNRFLYENLIYFYQPTPPQFLEKHGGYWEFLSDGDLTEIRLHHQWIESKESLSQLDCHNRTEARKKISEILKQHAYETLSKWKEILDEK